MKNFLDQFSVLLLDMNGTFMFGEDRFGLNEDFHATYRALGGTALDRDHVCASIRCCYEGMLQICRSSEHFDDFPSLAEALCRFAAVPEGELPLLERVFATHERGSIPPAYAALLCRLSRTHQLGLVTNVWARKELWLSEFERAGISKAFSCMVFSSDYHSIKPSKSLFRHAIQSFPPDSRIVFVGDSLHRDIEPAKSLGLATAWITTGGNPSPYVDHILPNLLAIEDLVPKH